MTENNRIEFVSTYILGLNKLYKKYDTIDKNDREASVRLCGEIQEYRKREPMSKNN